MEDLSVEELATNLSTYKDQLHEVRKLIKEKKNDPGISEYLDMEKELQEVITLTEEFLAKESESAQNNAGLSPPTYSAGVQSEGLDDLSHSHMFAAGTRVQAVWSEDGEWYTAMVEALTENGYYVAFDGWGNKEEPVLSNLNLHKTSGRMLGSSFKQPKGKLKRSASFPVAKRRASSSHQKITEVRWVSLGVAKA